MALNNIRSRLEAKAEKYKSIEDCANDVRLVWRNAMLYNAPGSKVYVIAQQLSEFWEALYAKVTPNDPNRPPTVDEMQTFAEKCHQLNQDELGTVIAKLDKDCQMCLIKKPEQNELEVNVDLMTGSAFRDAMKMLETFIPDQVPDNKRKRSSSSAAQAGARK